MLLFELFYLFLVVSCRCCSCFRCYCSCYCYFDDDEVIIVVPYINMVIIIYLFIYPNTQSVSSSRRNVSHKNLIIRLTSCQYSLGFPFFILPLHVTQRSRGGRSCMSQNHGECYVRNVLWLITGRRFCLRLRSLVQCVLCCVGHSSKKGGRM